MMLVQQWAAADSAPYAHLDTRFRREVALERARKLFAEATPTNPLTERLAAIEAKLDTLLTKRKTAR